MLQITHPNEYITVTSPLTRADMLFTLGYTQETLATAAGIQHMRAVNTLVNRQERCELVSVDDGVATLRCRLYGNTVKVPAARCVVRS